MKKPFIYLALVLIIIFSSSISHANTVTMVLEDIHSSGIYISSFQMFFLEDTDFGLPLLNNMDFTELSDNYLIPLGAWYLDFFDKSENFQTFGTGFFGGSLEGGPGDNEALYGLRDGFVVEISTTGGATNFAVDISTLDLFSFTDTANPIQGLFINESFDGGNQLITISSTAVPVPSTIILLSGGLIGLVAMRRRRS
jgi:hypothetical protein